MEGVVAVAEEVAVEEEEAEAGVGDPHLVTGRTHSQSLSENYLWEV